MARPQRMTHPLFRHVFKQGLRNNTWVYKHHTNRSNLSINYGENYNDLEAQLQNVLSNLELPTLEEYNLKL